VAARHLGEPGEQSFAHRRGVLDEAGAFHDVDDRQRHRAREVGPAEGGEVDERRGDEEFAQRLGVQRRRDRHERAPQGLGHRHDVGAHAEVFGREPPPGASETGLDLVEDQERSSRVADRPGAFEIVRRRHDDAALSLDRFQDDRRGLFGYRRGQGVAVAVGDPGEPRHERLEGVPEGVSARGGQREPGVAVVSTGGRDDPRSAGGGPGQFEREVDGFSASGAEHGAGELAR
jgi:hypothetical protein